MTRPASSAPALPSLKSEEEIEALRAAGRINAQAHRLAAEMIRPGVTPRSVDAAIAGFLRRHRAEPLFLGVPGFSGEPYPAVSCLSVNEGVAHGVPTDRPFRSGDVVSVDLGCRYRGWCADSAETYVVGRASRSTQRLVDATRVLLRRSIEEVGRRETWGDVVLRMEPLIAELGFQLVDVVFGHGIGREMHETPQVSLSRHSEAYDFVDFDLRAGLVFTIEPVLTPGIGTVRLADDQWTIITTDGHPAAHCEHTIAITEHGVEVLTAD